MASLLWHPSSPGCRSLWRCPWISKFLHFQTARGRHSTVSVCFEGRSGIWSCRYGDHRGQISEKCNLQNIGVSLENVLWQMWVILILGWRWPAECFYTIYYNIIQWFIELYAHSSRTVSMSWGLMMSFHWPNSPKAVQFLKDRFWAPLNAWCWCHNNEDGMTDISGFPTTSPPTLSHPNLIACWFDDTFQTITDVITKVQSGKIKPVQSQNLEVTCETISRGPSPRINSSGMIYY